MAEAQISNSEWASYRMTDPGLPEPDDLFRDRLGLRAASIRWTRSASEVDTLRMRAVSRRLGNGVSTVTRCLILFDHFSLPANQPPDGGRSESNSEPGKMGSGCLLPLCTQFVWRHPADQAILLL